MTNVFIFEPEKTKIINKAIQNPELQRSVSKVDSLKSF